MNRTAHAEKVRMLAKALASRHKSGAVTFAFEQPPELDGRNRSTWLNVVDALNLDLAADQRITELRSEAPAPAQLKDVIYGS